MIILQIILSEQTNLYFAQNIGTTINTTPQETEQFPGIHKIFFQIKKH